MRRCSPSGLPNTSATRCIGAPWSAPWRGGKKNADARADPPLLVPDGHTLVAHYEALRPAAVTLGSHPSMRARALLMRHGMAAWMHSVEDPARRAAIPWPARTPAVLPAGSHRPAIDILATMVLASARENAT